MGAMQVVVDGLLTQYDLSGKGKLVVLLHGWGDDMRTFGALKTELSSKFQVLLFDLPGFGGTQPPQEVWDLDNYSLFTKNLLNKLDLKQPYAVIGHSNGGAIAIRAISLKLLHPHKLVLLAAAGVRTGGGARRLILKVIAKTGKAATIWMPAKYRRGLRKSLYGVAGSDMLVVPQLQETFKKSVRQDVQADAASISIPALLIYGAKDRAVPVAYGRRYQQLLGDAKLEVLDASGHFVHHDKPVELSSLVMEFLR